MKNRKSLHFKRFKNKYLFISIILLFYILVISFFFHSEILDILLYDYSSEVSENVNIYEIKKNAIDSLLYWEFWLQDGNWYNEHILMISYFQSAKPDHSMSLADF